MIKLETKRLTLKVLQPIHADLVLSYKVENRAFVRQWSPIRKKDYYTLEYHKKNLEKHESDHLLRFFLFEKGNEDRIIGAIGFSNIIFGAFRSCHLGYSMLHSKINKGLITEALEKSIDYVFKEIKLHRIEANVMPHNLPSIKVLEKLDFENEGLRKSYLKINGQWEDHLSFVKFNDQ